MASLDSDLGGRYYQSIVPYIGAAIFVGGVFLLTIGLFSVSRTYLASITPNTTFPAILLTGFIVPTLVLLTTIALRPHAYHRSLTIGSIISYGSVALYGLIAPFVGALPTIMGSLLLLLSYAVGVSILIYGFFSIATSESSAISSQPTSVQYQSKPPATVTSTAISPDGGDEDDELEFLLDTEQSESSDEV